MRVLILPAILAVAVAAPSGVLKDAAPLAVLPVVAPTIDPGDIQAAAINAQVAAEDQARAAADKFVEENNEKVVESDSLVKEKTEETFWAGEDKKWQTLDAVQTAAAKIDGAVASNAEALARSALGGVVLPTYVAPSLLPAPLVRAPIVPGTPITGLPVFGPPIISPISPIVYPGLLGKTEEENKEKLVKTAEPEKEKQVFHTLYPGLLSSPVLSPVSPLAYIPVAKEDQNETQFIKTAELEKNKQQVLHNVYRAQIIPSTTYFFYNSDVFTKKEETGKEKENDIANTVGSEKDKQQVLFYTTRIVTTPIISHFTPIVHTTGILANKEDTQKENEIVNKTDDKKEQNKLDDKKDEKLEKPEADKLLKGVAIVPLVAPQWPLAPASPVYNPPQILTPVLNTHW